MVRPAAVTLGFRTEDGMVSQPLSRSGCLTWRNLMPMRPVELARYFSKVAAFMLIWVSEHSLQVSVTSSTNGAFVRHGGACITR